MARVEYRTCHTSDDAAAGYQRTYSSGYYAAQWHSIERPLLCGLFAEFRGQGARRMLDIACGQGRITLVGAQYFDQVIGIDYSPEMLAIARQQRANDASLANADLDFQLGDVTDYTAEAPFDVVTAFRFFLNAEDRLRIEGLRCVRRNLSPQGTFITNVHVAGSSPLAMLYRGANTARRIVGQQADPVRNSISLRKFRSLLASEGFEITRVVRYSLLPRIGSLTDRLAERHINKFERLASAIPGMALLCQSYIVCARPVATPGA